MAKDYAHRGSGGRQTSGGGMPGWLWLFVGIALGAVGAATYYISRPPADERVAAAENGKAKPGGKKKIEIPPKEQSRFAFYELLPNYEVVIPKEVLKGGGKPVPALENSASTSPGRYLIQVGSFKERGEADQQRANLALLGVESRIEKVTIDNDQTWYRVRIGPEKDQRRVETILSRLEENDIKAMVMMVPD
jgi:cell division protein FtsN